MDTINSIANSAAKAVWGDNEAKKEPLSGVSGDTSKGEPFDAGNSEEPQKRQAEIGKPELDDPSAPKDVSAPADSTSGQNDTRKPSNPSTDADPDAQEVTTQGNDLNKSGPKPLSSIAKENGGDAGNLGKKSDGGSGSSSASSSDDEDDNGIQKKSHGEGTGEKYVKSSGLKADGGDFDATKPGAGREADRLLEQKGVHREAPEEKGISHESHDSHDSHNHSNGDAEPAKEKVGLGERIKAKLHSHKS